MRHYDKIARLAKKQAGAISRPQVLALGIEATALRRAVRSNLLVRKHAGVYHLAGARPGRELNHWLALLWAGSGAALSHVTAGRLWKLDGLGIEPPPKITLSVPASRTLQPIKDVRVYRTRSLVYGRDYATLYGFPCTSLPRTLLDLAAVLPEEELEQAFDSVVRRHPKQHAAVLEMLGKGGHLGSARLADIARRDELGPTGSPLEVRMRRVLRRENISIPIPQLSIADHHSGAQIGVFDFAWPERGVVLLTDGYDPHAPRAAFEKDREQISALAANGWVTLLVTSRRLDSDSEGVVDALKRALTGGRAVTV